MSSKSSIRIIKHKNRNNGENDPAIVLPKGGSTERELTRNLIATVTSWVVETERNNLAASRRQFSSLFTKPIKA